MARGQGWEPGEEAETDLEQGAETGSLGREERRADVRTKRQETGRREGGGLGMSLHKYSEPCTHTTNSHPSCNFCLLRSLNKISHQFRVLS